MKQPKNEPYQRSRHRAALHALVFAATAVAAVGLPSSAADTSQPKAYLNQNEQTPEQQAHAIASYWIEALTLGDTQAAMDLMHLPSESAPLKAALTALEIAADVFTQGDLRIEPIAHRHAGKWALSAWSLEPTQSSLAPVIEPVLLYHPAPQTSGNLATPWQVMPSHHHSDELLKPMYNADHAELMNWSNKLL